MSKRPLMLNKGMLGQPEPPLAAESPPLAPPRTPPKAAKDYGVPLNFRVPEEFSERFRITAVRKKLKLHELLTRAFEVYLREEGEGR